MQHCTLLAKTATAPWVMRQSWRRTNVTLVPQGDYCLWASTLEAVALFVPKDILLWKNVKVPGGACFEIWPQGGTSEWQKCRFSKWNLPVTWKISSRWKWGISLEKGHTVRCWIHATTSIRCEDEGCICSILTQELTLPWQSTRKRDADTVLKNLLCVHINTVFAMRMCNWPARCVCVCIQTMHSVDSPQQCAFLLGEYMSSGLVPPLMTSGEAIILCINDEQQPVMREMDFVLRHRSADYGQQQCPKKKERK